MGDAHGTEGYEELFRSEWDKTYDFWHRVIDRGERQVAFLREQLETVQESPVRLLDVGCGNGDEIGAAMDRVDRDIWVVANDISGTALDRYRDRNEDVLADTYQCRLEALPERLDDLFDVILFSHCLHDTDLSGLFSRYAAHIDESGRIVVLLESAESTVVALRERFWKQLHDEPLEENTAEDVIHALEWSGFAPETTPIPYGMDVEKLNRIDPDGLRELYIPFAMRARDISTSVMEEMVAFLRAREEDGRIPHRTLAITAPALL